MTSLLNRLFGRTKRGSGVTAKSRLHFVLQHDRINLPPERAEEMKKEILAVIVKYLAVDRERVEIDLEQRDRMHSKLVAEIPIVSQTYKSDNHRPEPAANVTSAAGSNGAGTAEADLLKKETTDDGDEEKEMDEAAEQAEEPSAEEPLDEAPEDDQKRRA